MSDIAQPPVMEKADLGSAPASVPVVAPFTPPVVRRTGEATLFAARYGVYAHQMAVRIGQASADELLRGRAFLFVPVCLGAGSVTWFSLDTVPSPVAVSLLFGVLLVIAWFSRHGSRALHYVSAASALFACGMVFADLETRGQATVVLDTPVTTVASGVVERREAGARGEWRYVIRLHGTSDPTLKRAPQRISLLARARHQPFALGEEISGRVRISPPSGPALPGLNDFAFASYYNGVGAVGYFMGAPKRPAVTTAREEGWVAAADRWLFTLRDDISTRIRTVIPGDPGAFAASIITGERRSMSNDLTEALRLSGLAHITAISGLNMALAAGIFFVGLRLILSLFPAFAQAYPIKKFSAAGALAGTICYLLISGYQVSAVRAFLMTAIILVAVLFDRPAISLRNLALAAIVILALTPSQAMGPSFQMSFAATAALIAGYALWRDRPMRSLLPDSVPGGRVTNMLWHFVAGTVATSLIGGLSTAVFAVSYFHRLAPHSLEANLLAMPIISLWVMPAGLVAMLLMPFGLDGPFLVAMGSGLEIVGDIAIWVAGWGEGFGFPRMPAWFLPGMVAGLLLVTLLGTWLRHAGTLLIAAILATVWLSPGPPLADIVIAEDGQLIGLPSQTGEAIATNKRKPPSFVFRQWQQSLQIAGHQPPLEIEATAPPKLPTATPAQPPPAASTGRPPRLTKEEINTARKAMRDALRQPQAERFSCRSKSWCVARLREGWTVAFIEDQALLGIGCDLADIVITPRRPRFKTCHSGARLISAETLRQTGALEIHLGDRLTDQFTWDTAFSSLERPWTRHRLYDWRNDSFSTQQPEADEAGSKSLATVDDIDSGSTIFPEINDNDE